MNNLALAVKYAEDVRDGKLKVNKYIQLAIERHFRDLENMEVKGWYFSDKAAEKALQFFNFLVLTKGVTRATVPRSQINPDGTIRFQLAGWQAFLIASLFGWKKKENKKRRFTEAYVEIPKKNGKSTLASGIANYMLIADKEAGPEVYFGAYSRDQASICFDEAVAQIKDSKELRKRANILKYAVTIKKTRAKMMAVSHDGNNTEGKNSSGVVIDEYHVHKTDKVKDSLGTGMSARDQPLMFVVTTAGYNKQGPCYAHREMCIDMLENEPIDHLFCLIYGLDEEDDWKQEENWVKANPTLGVTTKISQIRNEFQIALRSGSKEVDFKTKRLNLWVDAAVTWIRADIWKALSQVNQMNPNLGVKYGKDWRPPADAICYVGVDLGRTSDIASVAYFFPQYNYLTVDHYVAEEAAEFADRNGISYKKWIRQGHLIATPGATTDYKYILRDIFERAETYDIAFVGIDPYGAQMFKDDLAEELGTRWVNKIMEDGSIKSDYYPVVQKVRQGFLSLGPPTDLFEQLALDGKIMHDDNPVTAWMLANVALDIDAAGNIKPTKKESRDKIDGIAASIMALAIYSEWHKSVLASTGVAAW